MSKLTKFFVYGTLKVGGRLSGGVSKYVQSVQTGSIKGKMYNAGTFPAVLLSDDDDKIVHGEVHEFKEPGLVHDLLDRIEGCYGENNPRNLYNKIKVDVVTPNGVETCFMYEFNRDVKKLNLPEVASGVWEV